MTPTEARQLNESPIWKAYVEGKTIQRHYLDNRWEDIRNIACVEDFVNVPQHFRIKPEKKELWALFKKDGTYRDIFTLREDAEFYAKMYDSTVVHMVEKN